MDATSRLVGIIDANRTIELATTDLFGMTLVRTLIEWFQRGPDAGRETIIRETMGMLCNVFVAGWLSLLMLRMLGRKLGWYNPQGIASKAWINARHMEAFGNMYKNILQDKANPVVNPIEARQRFIQQVLTGLSSTDRSVRQFGLPHSAESLSPEARVKYLHELAKDVMPEGEHQKLAESVKALSLEEQATRIKEAYQHADNGKLSRKSLEALTAAFQHKPTGATTVRGTNAFDDMAMAEVQEAKARMEAEAKRLNRPLSEALKHFDEKKEFMKARLRLSMADLEGTESEFIKAVKNIATSGKLTSTVQLHGPNGELLLKEAGRDTLFGELKHFLEQFVDRANHGITDYHGGSRTNVLDKLFGESKRTGLFAKLLPQFDEGLLRSAIKAKTAYTWIPLVGTVLLGMASGFGINWLSKKLHGGEVFFFGDGGPSGKTSSQPVAGTKPPQSFQQVQPAAPAQAAVAAAPYSGLIRNPYGPFSQLRTQRFGNGNQGGFMA